MGQTGILNVMRRLFRHRGGVIAMMFGIIYGPLTGIAFMGIATAMQTANEQRALALLDLALIAVAATPKSAINTSGTMTTAQIQAAQNSILQAYWSGNNGSSVCGTNTPVLSFPSSTVISATVTCTAATGVSSASTNYTATSQVTLQGYNVEVAMVLDNTGSMSWGVDTSGTTYRPATATHPSKISGMKQAALSFLQILQNSASAANVVRVGMVPFTTDVNIVNPGDPNQAATQVGNTLVQQAGYVNFSPSVMADKTSFSPGCSDGSYIMQVPVVSTTVPAVKSAYWSGASLGTSCGGSFYYYTMPTSFPGTNDANWLGCVSDRDEVGKPLPVVDTFDYAVSNTAPTSTTPNSLYPADNINCGGATRGPVSLVPLQDIYYSSQLQLLTDRLLCRPDQFPMLANSYASGSSATNDPTCATATSPSLTTINGVNYNTTTLNGVSTNTTGMLANGDTDLTIGLSWAFNMLTPSFPMYPTANQSSSDTNEVKKFLVFFTDGQNTADRFNAPNYGSAPGNMNTETSTVCTNIKAAGITIFAVGTADADKTVLGYTDASGWHNGCATPGDGYTGLAANQIQAVFTDIANQISNLRVSQ